MFPEICPAVHVVHGGETAARGQHPPVAAAPADRLALTLPSGPPMLLQPWDCMPC